MPGSGERAARREPSREAARRQAVTTLEVAGAVASYAARSIGNGLSPEAARRAVIDAAAELELVALEAAAAGQAGAGRGLGGAAG